MKMERDVPLGGEYFQIMVCLTTEGYLVSFYFLEDIKKEG